jgi:hypothetical protein
MKTPYAKLIKVMCFVVGVLTISFAQAEPGVTTSGDVKWVKAPAALPPGAELATLRGDVVKPGALMFRLKLPAGYQLKPQSSPALESLIVISGTFNLGLGEKFDKSRTVALSEGFKHWLDESPYFGWTAEETVIQIEGAGPWTVSYVNPGDDPRKRK